MSFESWLATADEQTLEVDGWGEVTIRELPRALQLEGARLRDQIDDDNPDPKLADEFMLFFLRHGMVEPKFTDEQLQQLITDGSKKRLEKVLFAIVNLSVQMRPETVTEQEVEAAERRFPE